jgi:hypothetical protein
VNLDVRIADDSFIYFCSCQSSLQDDHNDDGDITVMSRRSCAKSLEHDHHERTRMAPSAKEKWNSLYEYCVGL